ncbi:MAG: asparagine synthase (glutamine-hydrolyzing) [Bacteroidetes bacterium]|nr:MAG: asparagine synthase (glutamine-hydrolyzing) [Bacteroidota bacterium]
MCGITGFFSLQQNFSESTLKHITTAIAHRGPDADGFFFDGVCGLGHRRLSILDLSASANQPMQSYNKRYWLAFNGEVFNYRELAKQIETPLRTTSDSEVILELFSKLNLRAVYQFNGMFAFGIYDKEEQALYVVRDRIGVKPLYYYWDGQNFAFASELKALVDLPNFHKELNETAVSSFLHLGYVPAPHTIYKNIYKLATGSWLKVGKDGIHEGKFWNINEKIYDNDTQEKLALLNRLPEAKAQLKKLLHSSVNYRLISDVPVGVFLSGGIDSSLVAAIASQEATTKMQTFSIGFQENKFNEAPYAKAVANALGTKHHELIISVEEAKKIIPTLIDIYDEPYADSSAIPTLLLSRFTRQNVTVALGGDGGDELFLGYGMYQWASRLHSPLWRGFRSPLAGSFRLSRANRYQKAAALLNYGRKLEPSHIFSQEQQFFSKREIDGLLLKSLPTFNYSTPNLPRRLNHMEEQAFFDLQYYLPDDLLVKIDRATMRYGLEARVPLLDYRVIEFGLNLNPDLKFHKGTSKYLLKQLLYDYLPEKLFDRPKQGFAIPLVEWLKGDLKYLIDENLNPDIVKHYGIVKPEMVEMLKTKYLKGNTYFYNRVWVLMLLHQFLKKNFV